MSKIGVMGGTFDPVHMGHLAIAEEARKQLDMAEVVFIPAGYPYFKGQDYISPPEHRVKMLNLALADSPYFKISLIEIKRSGPSYAVDTLSRMKRQLNADDEIMFILGADSLLTLPRWERPERLITLCKIVVVPRPGYLIPVMGMLEAELPGISERTVIMEKPLINISSSDIRGRVQKGLPIADMVPAAVAQYIKQHRLYQSRRRS
jgi:nicotinate-nucleotide adenylyltransferase